MYFVFSVNMRGPSVRLHAEVFTENFNDMIPVEVNIVQQKRVLLRYSTRRVDANLCCKCFSHAVKIEYKLRYNAGRSQSLKLSATLKCHTRSQNQFFDRVKWQLKAPGDSSVCIALLRRGALVH